MDKVYIIERRTWSRSEIVDVFKNETDANNFANEKELNKLYSDGYNEYYVLPFDVK